MSMITAYEFTPSSRYDETDPDTIVVVGTDLRLPEKDGDGDGFFQVRDGQNGIVFVIAADRVRRVRGLTDDDLTDLHDQASAAESSARNVLSTALDHIENLIGPWHAQPCAVLDGAILESGVTRCMAHNRPGIAPGSCAVAEAAAFLDAHRDEQ